MSKRNWYPPKTLIGPHWELQLLHIKGHWACFTEHTNADAALALASRFGKTTTYRVVEVEA